MNERARRRQQDLLDRGQERVDLAELAKSIAERDQIDSTRSIAPLQKASDAIEIITDHLTIDQVVDRIISIYEGLGIRD